LDNISDKLLQKSIEAFLMAIEIYNKPTIKYRVEGFSFFICNAWELMLKAHLIKTKGNGSIYYTNNPGRTISLENAIKDVFTNNKDPLRLNLEKIIELRNTSTHFITEEYEMVYVPLFQACVLNFNDKIFDFFGVDMTEIIPQNFLTLSVSLKALNESEISAKYPEIISEKLFSTKKSIDELSNVENSKFAININMNHYITKDPGKADITMRIAKDGEMPVALLKEIKNPELIYKYSTKTSIDVINTMLKRAKIEPKYKQNSTIISTFHFSHLIKYYDIKNNPSFAWKFTLNQSEFYKYSLQAIEFLVEEIKKDPENILDKVKK